MNCKRVEQKVWDYLDGRLSQAERAQLEAHLADCEACYRAWVSAQQTKRALHQLTRYPAPSGFQVRLQARLRQATPEPARPRLRLGWKSLALAPALGLLFAWLWFGGGEAGTGSDATQVGIPSSDDYAQACLELHEALEVADWSPTPAVHYWVHTGYTR